MINIRLDYCLKKPSCITSIPATTSSSTPSTVLQTSKARKITRISSGSVSSASDYSIYIITGSIVLVLVLIILITVGVMCFCGLECNCRPKSRRPRTDQQFGMNFIGHPNDGITNMAPFPHDIDQDYLQLKWNCSTLLLNFVYQIIHRMKFLITVTYPDKRGVGLALTIFQNFSFCKCQI